MKKAKQASELLAALQDLRGEALYLESVLRVQKLLDADYVFTGEMLADSPTVHVHAFCQEDKPRKPYRYDLAGTPCANTLLEGENACLYLGDVVEKFPHHQPLKDLGVSSYIGVPIMNSKDEPAGLFVVLYKDIPTDTGLIPLILEIISTRLSHELQRKEGLEDPADSIAQSFEDDRLRLARNLHKSMCVLRLHLSISDQLDLPSQTRKELDDAANQITLIIENAL